MLISKFNGGNSECACLQTEFGSTRQSLAFLAALEYISASRVVDSPNTKTFDRCRLPGGRQRRRHQKTNVPCFHAASTSFPQRVCPALVRLPDHQQWAATHLSGRRSSLLRRAYRRAPRCGSFQVSSTGRPQSTCRDAVTEPSSSEAW